jgi:3-phosphoshikimate 1-carboxyvinyltransferase
MDYPPAIEIRPLTKSMRATVRVPGSKSITNRALVLAALSEPGEGSELRGVLQSEDTEVMIAALRDLGFRVQTEWDTGRVRVSREVSASPIPVSEANLFVANSGTTMRFLTAMVSLGRGRYTLDGVTRMRQRPIEDLLAALRSLGARATCAHDDGCPPVIIETSGLRGGQVPIKGNVSSQFLSGLLMAAPLAKGEITIEVSGVLVSAPYVEMTLELMRQFGVEVGYDDNLTLFEIPCKPWYESRTLDVEPDASAASYFFAAAAITGGSVRVPVLTRDSLQGDVAFLDILERMDCQVTAEENALGVRGGVLHGVDVDMNEISDTVMTLGAVACFAKGPTTIRNVAHIRHKETDRLAALATELRRVGASVDEFDDGLTITPGRLHGAEIETYNDHRMAMSMALVGLKVPGIIIKNPGCVAKTYPRFFEDLETLR